jgi:hypothetical protein
VNLPLWTVSSGDLTAGISLNYYGNPKVNDFEGSAGMGWSLVAGGGVYRQVKDLPDDFIGTPTNSYKGWLHANNARLVNNFTPTANNYLTCSAAEMADWTTMNSFTSSDTEPDIFSFNAPGLSGQFVFDKNKLVQTLPYQDLKIQIARQNSVDSLISQIVITNNKGYTYTFLGGDMTTHTTIGATPSLFIRPYNLYQKPIVYYSSWHLTKISAPTGAQINFSYDTPFTVSSADTKQAVNATTSKVDSLYTDNYSTVTQMLQSITGGKEKATLTWTGNLLSSVSVTDLTYQSPAKVFNLQYHYVNGSKKVIAKRKVKRAFLSGLTETLNCNAFPGYSFNYYGVNFSTDTTSLPFNSSIRQDLFGYYDSTAVSSVPDIYVKSGDSGIDGERYRIAPATGYSLLGSINGNRIVDPKKVYFGSLKTVTLPSGGTTTFTYEAADYYDAATNSSILGGGPRVKSIKISANDPSSDVTTTYKYRTTSSLSSGRWIYRPMFVAFNASKVPIRVPDNLAPNESILYSRVEVSTLGKGKTVYEYQNLGTYPATSVNGDFNATLTHLARPTQSPCENLGSIRDGYYTYPYAPNTNYDFERGLPTRVSDYSRAGKVVNRKLYTYQRTTLPVAQVSGICFDQLGDVYQYGKYTLLSNVNKMTATETSRVYDQADTTQYVETVSSYTYNGNQMLSQTSATNSDNSVFSKTYKYAKDYASANGDLQSQMIGGLVSANRHGTLIESISYNGSLVTGASLTLFNNNFGVSTIMPSQQLVLGDPTGFIASTISGNLFTRSPNYYVGAYYDAYDFPSGIPTIIRDQSRKVSSSIIGYNGSAIALDIFNARADQVAYSDFEPMLSSVLQSTAPTTNTDSWSGKYSLPLTSTTDVHQTIVSRGAGKNYRFSCWAKASGATTLSISINGGAAVTVGYPVAGATAGTWQYVELTVDMSAVASNFSFYLTSSGNINLDNVAFYPESASIVAHTYDPLNGKTADLDSRGVSGFQDYDLLGRSHFMRNMDKDIVQIKDYHYVSSNGIMPVSSFTGSAAPEMFTAVAYTANPTCAGGVNYLWNVYDPSGTILQTSTASTLTYTFTQFQTYRIRLTASASFGSTWTEMVINPVPVLNVTMNVSGPTGPQYCDTGPSWTLTANVTGCTSNLTYSWYLNNNISSTLGTGSSITFSMNNNIPTTIYCTVTSTCTNPTTGYSKIITGTVSQSFSCRDRVGGQ